MTDSKRASQEDIYDQIKTRLTAFCKDKIDPLRDSIFSPKDSIPGPGHYLLTPTYKRSESVRSTFSKDKRFRYTRSLVTETSDSTRPNGSLELSTGQTNRIVTEPNIVRSGRTDQSRELVKMLANAESKQLKRKYPLRGSFPKAIRDCGLAVDSPSAGPAMYNVALNPTAASFTFGMKYQNLSGDAAEFPGPGTYKPEDYKGESNHLKSHSAIILKAEKDFVNDIPAVKNPPTGETYYRYNHYTSLNASKKRGVSFGAGNRVDFVNKFQRDVPAPNVYPIQDSPLYSKISRSLQAKRIDFPSLGRPNNSKSPQRENLPGPAAYDPVVVSTSPSATIGTARRTDLFGRRNAVGSPFSELKCERLSRVNLRVSDLAHLTQAKTNSKHPCLPAKPRKMLFEELAALNPTPGFIYDLAKYHKLGKDAIGGDIGKGNKDLTRKEIDERMYIPGPATYDLTRDPLRNTVENTFGLAEHQSIFVKKDSDHLPGVGDYNPDYVMHPPKGGVIPRANKRLIYKRTQKGWKQATQENFISNDRSLFLLDLEDRVTELLKREKRLHAT